MLKPQQFYLLFSFQLNKDVFDVEYFSMNNDTNESDGDD